MQVWPKTVVSFFVCRHKKSVEQISRHWNLCQLCRVASQVTVRMVMTLFFIWKSPLFWVTLQQIEWCSSKWCRFPKKRSFLLAAISQFWQKTCDNKKHFERTRRTPADFPRHTVWKHCPRTCLNSAFDDVTIMFWSTITLKNYLVDSFSDTTLVFWNSITVMW